MPRINRDLLTALFLLLLCGAFFKASLQIRETHFGTLGSEVWPQVIIFLLFVLSLAYLAQSVRGGGSADDRSRPTRGKPRTRLADYRNALWCYALFAGFLLTVDYLGMLLGGMLFVFCALTVMGNKSFNDLLLHILVAVVAVGAMWAIFTFGLRVILPQGELLTVW
jgi:hypothetical protein